MVSEARSWRSVEEDNSGGNLRNRDKATDWDSWCITWLLNNGNVSQNLLKHSLQIILVRCWWSVMSYDLPKLPCAYHISFHIVRRTVLPSFFCSDVHIVNHKYSTMTKLMKITAKMFSPERAQCLPSCKLCQLSVREVPFSSLAPIRHSFEEPIANKMRIYE